MDQERQPSPYGPNSSTEPKNIQSLLSSTATTPKTPPSRRSEGFETRATLGVYGAGDHPPRPPPCPQPHPHPTRFLRSHIDMKRTAPSEEPLDVSSGDSSGSDSEQVGGKEKGGSASKAASAAAGEDMKRVVLPKETQDVSSDDDLSSDSEDDAGKGNGWNAFGLPNSSKSASVVEAAKSKKKKTGVDFGALSRHGYHGGPSVLTVRPVDDPNWSWSTGKDRNDKEDAPESYEERERTRAAVTEGEKLIGLQNAPPNQLLLEKDKKDASFSLKEKRRRDRGQASRGKNYVEEEKRLLRGSGVYSGFDT